MARLDLREMAVEIFHDLGLIAMNELPTEAEIQQVERVLSRRIAEAERLAIDDLHRIYGKSNRTSL